MWFMQASGVNRLLKQTSVTLDDDSSDVHIRVETDKF
jgi:hypothetical protein